MQPRRRHRRMWQGSEGQQGHIMRSAGSKEGLLDQVLEAVAVPGPLEVVPEFNFGLQS